MPENKDPIADYGIDIFASLSLSESFRARNRFDEEIRHLVAKLKKAGILNESTAQFILSERELAAILIGACKLARKEALEETDSRYQTALPLKDRFEMLDLS